MPSFSTFTVHLKFSKSNLIIQQTKENRMREDSYLQRVVSFLLDKGQGYKHSFNTVVHYLKYLYTKYKNCSRNTLQVMNLTVGVNARIDTIDGQMNRKLALISFHVIWCHIMHGLQPSHIGMIISPSLR